MYGRLWIQISEWRPLYWLNKLHGISLENLVAGVHESWVAGCCGHSVMYRGIQYLWVFSIEFASCHCSGILGWLLHFGKNFAPLPNTSSAGEDIPYIWWNLKVHYNVYKSPPLVCILSQINPVHTLAFCFYKMSLVWTLSSDKFTFLVCDEQLFMLYSYSWAGCCLQSADLEMISARGWACLAQFGGTAVQLLIWASDCCTSTHRLKHLK